MLINKDLLNSLIKVVGIELQNDRWITVKPNGEEEKGRHLLIKEGEDIGDAMRRQWNVQVKGQQKLDFKGAEKKYQEEQAKKEKTSKEISAERKAYADKVFEKHKNGTLTEQEKQEYLKKDAEYAELHKKATTKENNEAYKKLML